MIVLEEKLNPSHLLKRDGDVVFDADKMTRFPQGGGKGYGRMPLV